MRLTIKKLVFQQIVERAGAIVGGSCREILPVLKNFNIEATKTEAGGRLRVISTDMDLAVIAWTELVDVSEAGASIVPARKLMDMIKEAGDVDIILTTTPDVATITTPTTSWSIQLMKDQYPPIPEVTEVQWVEVDSEVLCAGLKKVRNAISADMDKRPELTLVKCDSEGVWATDGARLHCAKISLPVEIELPVTAVDDLIRILRSFPKTAIKIGQTEAHILFEIANHFFLATKLNVHFAAIQHIIDSKSKNTLELQVSRDELMTAIKRARITADEDTNRITMSLNNHKLIVETRTKDGASCKEEVSVHWPHGAFQVATNHIYLTQAITDMESPNVRLMFGQDRGKQKAPILIEEDSFYAVINQLRIE